MRSFHPFAILIVIQILVAVFAAVAVPNFVEKLYDFSEEDFAKFFSLQTRLIVEWPLITMVVPLLHLLWFYHQQRRDGGEIFRSWKGWVIPIALTILFLFVAASSLLDAFGPKHTGPIQLL